MTREAAKAIQFDHPPGAQSRGKKAENAWGKRKEPLLPHS